MSGLEKFRDIMLGLELFCAAVCFFALAIGFDVLRGFAYCLVLITCVLMLVSSILVHQELKKKLTKLTK